MNWLKRTTMDVIRVLTFIMAAVILIIAANGYLKSQSNNTKLLDKVATLTEQNKQLSSENKDLLQQVKSGTDSIHQQINCVLSFFSQPSSDRTSTSIASPNPCIITSSSGGATGATKSGQ